MASTNLELTGDPKSLERSYRKTAQQHERLIRKLMTSNAKLREEGGKLKRESTQAWSSVGQSIGSVAAQIVGPMGIAAAFSKIREEIAATAKAAASTMGVLQSQVAGGGDISKFGQVAHGLRHTKASGAALFTMAQRGQIYGAVRGAMPQGTLDQVMTSTEAGMQAGLIYGDVEQSSQFAAVHAELQRAMPGLSSDDRSDMAALLTQSAGKFGQKLGTSAFKAVEQLMASGMSGEKAVSLLLASFEAEQGTQGVTALASYVAGGKRGRLSPAGRAVLAEAKATDYKGIMRGAMDNDLFQTQLRDVKDQPELAAFRSQRQAEVSVGLSEWDDRAGAQEAESARDYAIAFMRKHGVAAWRRVLNLKAYDVSISAGNTPYESLGVLPYGEKLQAGYGKQRAALGLPVSGLDRELLKEHAQDIGKEVRKNQRSSYGLAPRNQRDDIYFDAYDDPSYWVPGG